MKRVFLIAYFLSSSAYAWGPQGHAIVCQIAEEHLSAQAKASVNQVLGKMSFSDACNWPDRIRKDKNYGFALTWHYVTIPNGETYQSAHKESKGDVIEASERMAKVLTMDKRSPKEKREALSFLGHLVGDLHQPLHVGRENDRGGNQCVLAGGKQAGNLHFVWDTKILESMGLQGYEMARRLALVSPQQVQQLQKGSFDTWAAESMVLREERVYPAGKGGSNDRSPMCAKAGTAAHTMPMDLPNGYLQGNQDVIRDRLQAAGVRLAGVLNRIFN